MTAKDNKQNVQPEKKGEETKKPAELAVRSVASERFTNKVMAEYEAKAGNVELSSFQKRLIQNYFLAIDASLQLAEIKRSKKSEQYRDAVPVTWENVDMPKLAVNVVARSRVGLDPGCDNHINMMPFKNNHTNKYDITFITGYRGLELVAKKYGLEIPDDVIIEVVYEKDKFFPIKKDKDNSVETYIFKIAENPFDRGEIVGGFYYHRFIDDPEKCKLVWLNLHEIEKRKPEYASVEFWGGEKTIYEGGKKTGKTEQVEGWREKMIWKTIYRAAYNDVTIDSKKIDDALMDMLHMDAVREGASESYNESLRSSAAREINEKSGVREMDISDAEEVNDTEPEKKKDSEPEQGPMKQARPENKTEAGPDPKANAGKNDPAPKLGF